MDVGLCPARIAAADQMEYFHGFSSENRLMGWFDLVGFNAVQLRNLVGLLV